MSKILIFGGSGFLGSNLKKELGNKALTPTRKEVDLRDIEKIYAFIEINKPSIIIYSAGITKIDYAQKNKELTTLLNYKIPNKISEFLSNTKTPFIYLSTDAVFDGYTKKFMFSEEDRTKPKSYYGKSKEKGEYSALENSNLNSVVRLISLFDIGNDNNFAGLMVKTLKENKKFEGITDQIQNPLNVTIAGSGINYILKNKLRGIYHLGALDFDSNYNFLLTIANKLALNNKLLIPVTFKRFMKNKIGHRKQKSVLLCSKFNKETDGKILSTLSDSF